MVMTKKAWKTYVIEQQCWASHWQNHLLLKAWYNGRRSMCYNAEYIRSPDLLSTNQTSIDLQTWIKLYEIRAVLVSLRQNLALGLKFTMIILCKLYLFAVCIHIFSSEAAVVNKCDSPHRRRSWNRWRNAPSMEYQITTTRFCWFHLLTSYLPAWLSILLAWKAGFG